MSVKNAVVKNGELGLRRGIIGWLAPIAMDPLRFTKVNHGPRRRNPSDNLLQRGDGVLRNRDASTPRASGTRDRGYADRPDRESTETRYYADCRT
jgi:hypothetical protein